MVRRDHIEETDDPSVAGEEVLNFAPMKRIAIADEIATAILYFASDDASFVTGSTLQIQGGSMAGC